MPIKKPQTQDKDEDNPSDDDVLISTTYVPSGAYVVIAMDESVDSQVVLWTPNGIESVRDRRVRVIARDLAIADALRQVADLVEKDMAKTPKAKASGNGPVKQATKAQSVAAASKRGGAGPQKTADPDAPWGRLADGTPKQKPGRRPSEPAPEPTKVPVKKLPAKAAANGAPAKKGVAAANKAAKRPSKSA
jgi:hypothetical protein